MPDSVVDMLMENDGMAQPAAPANPAPVPAAVVAQPSATPEATATDPQGTPTNPVTPAVPPTSAPSAPPPAEKTVEELQMEADAEAKKELGLESNEPETVETLREKYRASSREGHALRDDFNAVDASLEKQGLKRIRQEDGTYEFAPTDKYLDDFATPKADAIAKVLSDDEKETAFSDVPKFVATILKKIAATGAKPRATMKAEAVQISAGEAKQVRADFDKSQGDAFKPFTPYMDAMVERGVTPSFQKWMHSNRENYAEGLKLIQARVHKALAPKLAVIDAARQKQEARQKAAAANVLTPSQGAVHSLQGAKQTPEQEEADRIVNAKRF